MPYFVYLLECGDRSIYTGITTDLQRRLAEHRAGKGSRYARSRKAVRILHSERFSGRSPALRREAEIKSWPRARKLRLIKGMP